MRGHNKNAYERVTAVLEGASGSGFLTLKQVAERAGYGTAAVSVVLSRLSDLGMVTRSSIDGKTYWRAT